MTFDKWGQRQWEMEEQRTYINLEAISEVKRKKNIIKY